ncbi:TnsA-like heteromeric transposase endonuclease subunit [Flexivirga meconopsidis]|uniref:TnsA-like heteromeric transposase endonuclease subunit n=1 Tax=Flexivirga meconopsidis TaxID=2977121 RepID=UPI00223EA8C9|nr:TnsA-like heteromeric transposase endonuclease subunit [Flexivirga meconopsidis]
MALSGVSWAFRVGEGANLVTWDWSTGWPPVRELRSVRRPVSHARSRHIPVRAVSVRTGSMLRLESGLEHSLFRVLDRDPGVAWLVAQPVRLSLSPEVGRWQHVPDLLALMTSGEVVLWDARPRERVDEALTRAVALTADACREVEWSHRVFHGQSASEGLNTLWLHGFRHDKPWHEQWADRLVDVVQHAEDPVTVADVLATDDGSGEAVSTFWHLVWSGELVMDLSAPIGPDTTVTAPTTIEVAR